MQENHLKPNEEGFQDNSQDLINASLLFARALGLILKENEGIVVDVVGDIKLGDEVKKVIVFKFENQVHIYKCDEDIPEGNAVNMDTSAVQGEQE
jgi:pheromone shutdown protein TraB